MLINKSLGSIILLLIAVLQSCDREAYPQGQRIYNSQCANCHMEDGQGLGRLIPPIQNSDYYVQHYDDLVCIINYGMSGKIVVNGVEYEEIMPAARKLTEAELSNLINYMNAQWYPAKKEVNFNSIRESLNNCKQKKAKTQL